MLEYAKYILIISTFLLAVWGTFHDYKTDGKINRKGFFALIFLVIFFASSVVVEILSNRKEEKETLVATEQLRKENLQRLALLKSLEKLDEQIASNIKYLENLKTDISSNYIAIQSAESNLMLATEIQLAQQKGLDNKIQQFRDEAKLQLNRLSLPIKELYLSVSLKFTNADGLFPEYYEFLRPDHYFGEGSYVYTKREIPPDFDFSKSHYFDSEHVELSIYNFSGDSDISNVLIDELEPELLLSTLTSDKKNFFDGMYSNLNDASIIKNSSMMLLRIKKSKGSITSQLDFTNLAMEGQYAILEFTSTYPEEVTLVDLELHMDNSQYSGLKLNDCELISRHNVFTYVLSESSKINHFQYTYACKLWTAEKLSLR